MSLRVLDPGLQSLVVDLGRPNWRALGVPVGGAADRCALMVGNALVGNAPDAAGLEVNLAGPVLRAECDLACVLYGAPFRLTSDRQRLTAGKTFTLAAGEQLTIETTYVGVRAYFCVKGGLQVPEVLGGRSGLEPVRADTDLPCLPGSIAARFVRPRWTWNRYPLVLRVLDGAQASWFSPDDLTNQSFNVSPASNRMGLRLRGKPLAPAGGELVSEPVCPGTVQVTRDGQCVILGVDGQTIGGYPKIAHVIQADLDKLAQLRPEDRVQFERVHLGEAERLGREKAVEIDEWLTRLNTAEHFESP